MITWRRRPRDSDGGRDNTSCRAMLQDTEAGFPPSSGSTELWAFVFCVLTQREDAARVSQNRLEHP